MNSHLTHTPTLWKLLGFLLAMACLGFLFQSQGALSREWTAIEEALKQDKTYIDISDEDGITFFLAAATEGNIEAMKMLKALGANLYTTNKKGSNALHLAAAFAPNGDAIVWLLENTALTINSRDHDGTTPFMTAAWRGNIKTMETLKECDADLYATDKEGKNALHYAAAFAPNGDPIKWLLHNTNLDINSRDYDGGTPFIRAASLANIKTMETLKACGADLYATDKEGRNALHYAAALAPNGDLIKWIFHNTSLDINSRNHRGVTSFMGAALYGNIKTMETLKKCGADLYATDKEGRNAADLTQKQPNKATREKTLAWLKAHGVIPTS